jgi:hypothetical protein
VHSVAQDWSTHAVQHEVERAEGFIVEGDDDFVGTQHAGFLLALKTAHLCGNVCSGRDRELHRELSYASCRARHENSTA